MTSTLHAHAQLHDASVHPRRAATPHATGVRMRTRIHVRGPGSVSKLAFRRDAVANATSATSGIADARRSPVDLCSLARRDHDELDLALSAMVSPETPLRELPTLLDVFRLGLAVHLVAEARVHQTLHAIVRPPRSLRVQLASLRHDHASQQQVAERMMKLDPGCDDWYCAALELRVLLLDHARRQDYLRAPLEERVPAAINRGLVAQYATERMKLLASTSPVALARAVNAA